MTPGEYLDLFDANRTAILEAAERDLDAPVRGCPGWDVGALAAHVGGVYTFWNKWLRDRPVGAGSEGAFDQLMSEREQRLPGYTAWRDSGFAAASRPPAITPFVRSAGDELAERLRDLAPDVAVWTFFPSDQTVGFVQRRIAQETTIHRWDAEQAQGVDRPIPVEPARDGIDEYLHMVIQLAPDEVVARRTSMGPTRFQFLPSDTDEAWTVEYGSQDRPKVTEARLPADVILRGTVSDLLLYMFGRVSPSHLHVAGETSLAHRWSDFSGAF